MTEYPPITVVMTSYFPAEGGFRRRDIAYETLSSWEIYLQYKGDIHLHIADDGSSYAWERPEFEGDWPVTHSRQEQQGYGASLNTGFRKAFETSPLALHAVDDWALQEKLDLTPWVDILMGRDDIGVVRLGPPHPNLRGIAQMLSPNIQGWGLVLERQGFVLGLRPALFHKRLFDTYGWFIERLSALEMERIYNEHFCATPGPEAVLALPHPWNHLGEISLSGLEPKRG